MIKSNKPVLKSKKKTVRRKKSGKKIFIPASSIITLCAIIVGICTALLLSSTVFESGRRIGEDKKIAQTSVKKQQESSINNKKNKNNNDEKSKNEQKLDSKKDDAKKSINKVPESKNELPKKNTSNVPLYSNSSNSTSANSTEKKVVPPQRTELENTNKSEIKKNISDIPEIPIAKNGARLAVIFDDGGQNLSQLEKCISLPFPVTVAVLPKLQYSKESAQKVRASGNELILHQPMQALNLNVNPGAGAIKPEMSLSEISSVLRENIEEIGPVKGLNNHEGSLISEDEARIGAVLQTASELGIYFLDSRTTSQSRVAQAAMSMGYSYYQRNIFLDNTKNRSDIINEIMKGLAIANKTGVAIMIGHVWSADVLPIVLADMYPILVQNGYKFVTVSNSGALITP